MIPRDHTRLRSPVCSSGRGLVTRQAWISPDVLILDDLGLHRLTLEQSVDLYELVLS